MISKTETPVLENLGEFVAKVRRRITFGAPADVVGTAGVNTKRFVMATYAWAWGYEQALADLDATTAVFEKAFRPAAMGIAPSVTDHPFRAAPAGSYYAQYGRCAQGIPVLLCGKIEAEHARPVRSEDFSGRTR